MNKLILYSAASVVCFAAGFIASKNLAPAQAPVSVEPRVFKQSALAGNERSSELRAAMSVSSKLRQRASSTKQFSSVSKRERMKSILNDTDPVQRCADWVRFLSDLQAADIGPMAECFLELGLDGDNPEYKMLLAAWARQDPAAALERVSQNLTSRELSCKTILAVWASRNPREARNWAMQHDQGEDVNPWMLSVIQGATWNDPDYANELMLALPSASQQREALDLIYKYHVGLGPQAAREWTLSIQEPSLRAHALKRVASQLSRLDPGGTVDWLLANPVEGDAVAMGYAMWNCAKYDRERAAAYFDVFTDPEMIGNALGSYMERAAFADLDAAVRLLLEHPDQATAKMITQCAWATHKKSPEQALSIVSLIKDPEQRSEALYGQLYRWLQWDQDGALSWIRQHELPTETYERLRGWYGEF